MEREEIRNLLVTDKKSKHFFSQQYLNRCLKTFLKNIKNRIHLSNGEANEAERWLTENFDFFVQVKKSIETKDCKIRSSLFDCLEQVFLLDSFCGDKEDVFSIVEELSKSFQLDEKELKSLRSAFLIVALKVLSKETLNGDAHVPRLVKALHILNRIDFTRIAICFSPVEKSLRLEPAGIYSEMTRKTREQYRERLTRDAHRKKIPVEHYVRNLLEKAATEKKHIGFYLSDKKINASYFILISAFAFILVFFSFGFTRNVFLSVLTLPILYFASKSIFDMLFSVFIKSEIIPAMKCEQVSLNEKTCVVITTLITSKKDVEDSIKKIRRYCRNNKEEADELYFGILCDLKQSHRETEDDDDELTVFLKSEIERINKEENSYFAVIRKRVYHESENAYVGWERKRGAIEQFIQFLNGAELPPTHTIFGNNNITATKYLITLDSDSELGIGQGKRLIGKMIHPLNRPRIAKLKNGRLYVTQGYGIIQPRVAPSLLNPITTPYAKIFSNGSGKIPYVGASFDNMQTIFNEGIFCGKGIIDVVAYDKVVSGVIPEQKILSHDMPEGALLRCGIACDEYFLDSDPQTSVSSDKRQHRWIRGDIQNLTLLNILPPLRRIFAIENLFRTFVPIFEFLLLFFSSFVSKKAAVFSAILIVLVEFSPLLNEVFCFVRSGNFHLLSRHFKTRIRNRVLNTSYQCFLSLSGIAHKFYNYSDAILRSLYRMLISKKKLLEWQTYSPFTSQKKDPLLYYFPSILLSILLLFSVNSSITLFISLLFVFYPFAMLSLSEKYIETDTMDSSDKKQLLEAAKKEFLYFQNTVGAESSFLPPDNVQFEPIERIANRTSPTNIGLYLASLVNAVDLGLVTQKECLKKLEKALDSIEKMEHYQGHLYNWYDLSTLGVIGDRFISTVDSGNFIASLIVVSGALSEWKDQSNEVSVLVNRIEKEIVEANFKTLFDRSENLFYVGIFPDEKKRVVSHYDLYMSEARTTSYLAIATSQIPASHWNTTSRPILALSGRVGLGSWTGTCFEYFMPSLFLPIVENSLEDESLDFAHFCQKKYGVMTEFGHLYGISESGYLKTDDHGNLQYLAFGVPYLSIQDRTESFKVFSPYSIFLMLERIGKDVFKVLETLKEVGALGAMGYYEAIEFNSNFIDDYKVVHSYMAHHKGMSFLALANALNNNKNRERFLSRSGFSEKLELVAERFPIEGKIYRKKVSLKPEIQNKITSKIKNLSIKSITKNSSMITDGKVTFISQQNGRNRLLYNSTDVFHPQSGGLKIKIIDGNENCIFDSTVTNSFQFHNGSTFAEQMETANGLVISLKFSPIFGCDAFYLKIETNGTLESSRIEIDFDLMMQKERVYASHPAFHNLSLEASSSGGNLRLRRRGIQQHKEVTVSSNRPFKTKLVGFRAATFFDWRLLYEPNVKLIFEISKPTQRLVIPLVFSFGNAKHLLQENCFDGSYDLRKDLCEIGEKKCQRIDEICKTNRRSERILFEEFLEDRKQRFFSVEKDISVSRDFLWSKGISGDSPIISFFIASASSSALNACAAFVSAYKKMALTGIADFDLVILQAKSDGYFDPIRDELSRLFSLYQCDYLIGKHPGIHVAVAGENEIAIWRGLSDRFYSDRESSILEIPEMLSLKPKIAVFGTKIDNLNVGEFTDHGFLIQKQNFNPKEPFSHIICDGRLGFVCNQNSLGFTWYRNAGLNRISKWDNLPTENDGEKIFLEFDGVGYDLLQNAKRVSYLNSTVLYEGELFNESYTIIAFILEKVSVKCMLVLLSDRLKEGSRLIFSFVPSLGQNNDRNVFVNHCDGFVTMCPSIYGEYSDKAFFYADGYEISLFHSKNRLCFSVSAEKQNKFFLGGISGKEHFDFVKKHLQDKASAENLARIKTTEKSEKASRSTQEFWLRYQVLHSRFLGRTGLYQSSGAFGFRDQLQDCLSFLGEDPNRTKIHLIRCAAHQFREGDVLHWWHPIRNQKRWDPGVRSRCSDDYLWLIYGVDAYITETRDESILKIPIPFLKSEFLKPDEHERYLSPEIEGSEIMLVHLESAVRLFIGRGLGPHNLPDAGCGDWNDGMNQIDGESVWLGFFGAICLNRAKKYVSEHLKAEINSFLLKLCRGLESAYNGIWYARAIRRNGQILGSDISTEAECSIDLITQAFAAFYFLEFYGTEYVLEEKTIQSSLNAAYDILVDHENRVVKLFTRPFQSFEPSPGYIQRYCSGVRENGGQYTHAAVWFGLALLEYGKFSNQPEMIEKARQIADLLDPMKNITLERYKKYRREPYVLCGDVYDAKGFQGHGGWSWYTGAAAWYLKLLKGIKDIDRDPKTTNGH